jgi:hypothetical protein
MTLRSATWLHGLAAWLLCASAFAEEPASRPASRPAAARELIRTAQECVKRGGRWSVEGLAEGCRLAGKRCRAARVASR